jgi:flagellar hook protein FlgE
MGILNAIFTSLSGMSAYEKGLTIVGNNVANLDTAGYKMTEPLFSSVDLDGTSGALVGSAGPGTSGGGVTVDDSRVSFSQGQDQTTGNPLDAAVNGEGFFVVQGDSGYLYTRAGQFQFDQNGNLVETTTGDKVMVATSTAATGSFNLNGYRSYPPKATATVELSGNLARTGQTTSYVLPNITVVDAAGGTETLQASFTQDSTNPLHWTVQVTDSSNKVVGTGDLTFNSDGTPASANTPITVTVTPASLPSFKVKLDFGAAGSYAGVTSLASNASSQLQVLSQDGVQLGTLTGTSFGSDGTLTLTYSNGQTKTPCKLLLAQFDSPQELQATDKGFYVAVGNTSPTLGTPLTSSFGSVLGGQLEMSNVDLSQQFTDLIVIERGYQASSQINSIANQMMQQLLDLGSGR